MDFFLGFLKVFKVLLKGVVGKRKGMSASKRYELCPTNVENPVEIWLQTTASASSYILLTSIKDSIPKSP